MAFIGQFFFTFYRFIYLSFVPVETAGVAEADDCVVGTMHGVTLFPVEGAFSSSTCIRYRSLSKSSLQIDRD